MITSHTGSLVSNCLKYKLKWENAMVKANGHFTKVYSNKGCDHIIRLVCIHTVCLQPNPIGGSQGSFEKLWEILRFTDLNRVNFREMAFSYCVFLKGLPLQIKNLAPKKFAMQSKVCLESVHMGIIKTGPTQNLSNLLYVLTIVSFNNNSLKTEGAFFYDHPP